MDLRYLRNTENIMGARQVANFEMAWHRKCYGIRLYCIYFIFQIELFGIIFL